MVYAPKRLNYINSLVQTFNLDFNIKEIKIKEIIKEIILIII